MQPSWSLLVFNFSTCFRHQSCPSQEYKIECYRIWCSALAMVLRRWGGICVHSMDAANLPTYFYKICQYHMSINPSNRNRIFPCGETDRHTYRHDKPGILTMCWFGPSINTTVCGKILQMY
jgi:hypothetical protein